MTICVFERHFVTFHLQETISTFFDSVKHRFISCMMETSKGKPIFEHESYLYIINKESGNKVIWCRRNSRRGRLHTMSGQVIKVVGEHNYEPIHSVREVIEARTKMNTAAKQTVRTIHDIVTDGVANLSDDGITSLPSLQNLKRTFLRIRQKHQNPFSLPTARDFTCYGSIVYKN